MDTKSWIVASGSWVSNETLQGHIKSLNHIFNQFKGMSSLKTIAFQELEEQLIELTEYANKYYDVTKFNPTEFWPLLRQSIKYDHVKNIFLLAELSFCASYSNATIEKCFNYMKIVKLTRLNEKNMEALLQIKAEGPVLQEFIKKLHKKAGDSWWEVKQQRVQHNKQKAYAEKNKAKKTTGLSFPMNFLTIFENN